MTDVSQSKKILRRRYYLVEKAKDANMIGILVGTLGAGIVYCVQTFMSSPCPKVTVFP